MRSAQAGFSLVEVVVSAAILGGLVYAVSVLSLSGGEAQEYARRLGRATELTHDLLDQMRTEMVSSVRIFGNDTEGTENRAMLDLAGAPTPLSGLRLPTITTGGSLRPDTSGSQITGNSLFFTRLAWSDRFVCVSGEEYYVDVFRWVYYYLTPEGSGPTANSPIGLNLVRIESEPLVDAASLDRITDSTDLREVLLHLADASPDANGDTHTPCEIVWRKGSLPSVLGTVRQIDVASLSLSDYPIDPRQDPFRIERTVELVQGLLSYRHHSIATNYARASFGVGRYGLVDNSGAGFPHGFEVQVVGPSTARQTVLRLVVSSTNLRGQWAWNNEQVVVDTRDQ
jgi:prepilin-type N-terminal cleavage/methylation domain-containing protein